jgi:membrane-bound lytic murein transglycosylase F
MRTRPARVASPARLAAPGLAAALALLLFACKPSEPPAPPPSEALVVAVRSLPSLWETGPGQLPQGFEHDLMAEFAATSGLPLKVVKAASGADLAQAVASGRAHIGAGGLYRTGEAPPPELPDGTVLALQWSAGVYRTGLVIASGSDGFRPRGWPDLAGASVAYVHGVGIDAEVARLAVAEPRVAFAAVNAPDAEALLARVSDGRVDYALVSALQARLARNVHLGFEVAFTLPQSLELAWLLPREDAGLARRLEQFIAGARRSGLIDRLAHRYFDAAQKVPRPDAGAFQERLRTVLPEYRRLFFQGQEATGIDWRLLAAVAYQESQWDPLATSETGVRGMMQLTEETARRLGVADRLDPRQSVIGAARYLQDLKARLPPRIGEPDRTWLALAAFNIGLGHLEDARVLAQRHKLDPDRWQDVKQTLPLLARPEYYETTKLGYARGGMPVAFVDRVRGYYDLLLRHEPAHGPRLSAGDARPVAR